MSARPPADETLSLIARGAALHEAGQLDEAAGVYTEILARSPGDFDATHLLGVVALQQGRFDVAQRTITAALAIRPNDVSAVSNLGVSFLRDGQLEAALQWFEIAVKLQPDSSLALANAAEVMYHLGRYRAAVPLLQKACLLDPESFVAHNLLGACFMKLGDAHDAAAQFEIATRLNADGAEAWANLSRALHAVGESARARECADQAARLEPDSQAALNPVAGVQLEQGRLAEAIENYQRGVSAAAPSVEMLLTYANALLANSLNDAAIEQLARALALDENNVTVRWAMAMAQLRTIYRSEAEAQASRQAFDRSLGQLESWYRRTPQVQAPFTAVGTVQPFLLAYQPYNNRDLLARYGALCAACMATLPGHVPCARSATGLRGKLRLGVVSAHIRDHSIWTAVTKGWVQHLDRKVFEIEVFHLDRTVDRETEAVMRSVAHFDNRAKPVTDWAETILRRELDVILYPEIGSDPLTVKLASLRLAPVQAVSWGHPETSGLPTIDLFLSAQAFEPSGAAQSNYTEKLVALPGLGVYVEPLALPDADPDLDSLGLPTDQPLLLCPGTPFKYAPQFDQVWVDIAKGLQKRSLFRRIAAGRLIFFRSQNETWDRLLEERLRQAFKRGGVDFDAHASILPFLTHPRFFGLMRRAALMLDTLGFSGFNTALQGIECGLPVLAFEGGFLRGRLASAIMRELELPELVAANPEEFVRKAVTLAKQPSERQRLRGRIIAGRDKLFRNLTTVRALERCLMEEASSGEGAR